ncbi:hypothetical protein BDN72DRAFT_859715 [Pluteus cervinus]|uniref:Uncharacterized protein n=1 Tax=Pluteus cervinus TaxID=181527 RepID=A0ACD3ALT0_9AGAR|nr:hypothetical protein BDN72DRAFT_859715 [Pluteus cervinus]
MKTCADEYHGFRIPTRLVENMKGGQTACLDRWGQVETYNQFQAICAAVEKMEKLETFMWDLVQDRVAISGTNDQLLELVARKCTLRNLQLSDETAIRGLLDSLKNPRHSIWRMPHLEALIIGYDWSFRVEHFEPFVIQEHQQTLWVLGRCK